MSASSNRAPGFFWLLAVFTVFAIGGAVLNLFGSQERPNPRDDERAALAAEIKTSHQANLGKMGLVWGDSTATLKAMLPKVVAMKPSTSTVAVPGSPTQLKQAAAAAPAPAAAAAAAPQK
jgi:hypothetical protein